ncbi:MAG: tRNA (adenine(22)-N(1))-methyltransferase TrmK, partial [Desulfurispora sp.]|uniref:tRNA (adenine(22)-N(1))-methyltransferase TrmK n=1 Tax=Desulfurispora sp. TaxID=3014275 RepID=UPI00404B0AD8
LQTAPPGVLAGLQRLVLQPMADAGALRLFLARTGYALVQEELVLEGGQLYPVLAAEPGAEPCTDRLLLELGPRLYEKRHPLLADWLVRELAGLDRTLAGLERARQRDAQWEQRVARLAGRRARLNSLLEELRQ